MSFGASVSDVALCVKLTHKVWRRCRDAPGQFGEVSAELASLHLVLRQVEEAVTDIDLDDGKRTDLQALVGRCNGILKELEELLEKYGSLGTQSKRTWDRLRWGQERVQDIRQRVAACQQLLTSFHVALIG